MKATVLEMIALWCHRLMKIFRDLFIRLELGPSWQIHVWIQILNFQTRHHSIQRKRVLVTILKVLCYFWRFKHVITHTDFDSILKMVVTVMQNVLINIIHHQIMKPRKVFIHNYLLHFLSKWKPLKEHKNNMRVPEQWEDMLLENG